MKTILDLLKKIPTNCSQGIIVQGVELQIIDEKKGKELLAQDPEDRHFHQCILQNGCFIFTSENHKLTSLYKVV